MHSVPVSNIKEEEMKEQYYDALSPEEMKKLTEPIVAQQSDDAEKQVQGEETSVDQNISENQFRTNDHIIGEVTSCKEEDEEQYFDAILPEEINGKKKSNNLSLKENVAECNVGQELEDGEYKESTADIWIPPNERNRHPRKTNSQDESYISKVSSVADENTFDFETFIPRETDNEEVNSTLNEQRTELEQQSNDIESQDILVANGILDDQQRRNFFDPKMTESQCEMQIPKSLSFGEQGVTGEGNLFDHKMTESQDYIDNPENSSSVEDEERYFELACSSRAPETLQMYGLGTTLPVGMELDYSERKQTNQQPYVISVKIYARVFKYQSLRRCHQDKGMVFEAALIISFDLTKSANSAKSFCVCGGYILLENEHGTVIEAAWIISFDLTKSENSAKSFCDCGEYILKGTVIKAALIISFDLTKSANSAKSFCDCGGYILKKIEHLKGCGTNVIHGRIYRVGTFKESVGKRQKRQEYTKKSNIKGRNILQIDIRCTEIHAEASLKYPDRTNDARKNFQETAPQFKIIAKKKECCSNNFEYTGFPHVGITELDFDAVTRCNKKEPSTDTQKENVVAFTFEDDSSECFSNKDKKYNSKQAEPPVTIPSFLSTLNQETLDGNKQNNINETSEEKPRFVPSKDLSQNSSDAKEENRTPDKILSEARNNEDGEGRKKLNAEKQMGSDIPLSSWHISRLLKCFIPLLFLCLPGAGGSGPEDGQNNQQAVPGIYKHTVATVSHCPSVSEYTWRASEKCGEVCGTDMQNEICKYHCMRDSYRTSIVEFCAKPQIHFVYCPMYDPIGRTIQMDLSTLCDPSNSSKKYFNSSDVFFCDPDNCLRLREAAVSTVESMIETTTSSGGINDGWLIQNWYILMLIGLVVVLFVVGCIFRSSLSAFFRMLMKKRNPDDKQAEVESMLV